MKYHSFIIKRVGILIVVEPVKRQYVWLHLNLDKSIRNGKISAEITKYALYKLNGIHHIHWLKKLKTFSKLSKELKWETINHSNIFLNCNYSYTLNLKKPTSLFPLLNKIVIHQITKSKPTFFYLGSESNEKLILNNIRKEFNLIEKIY